MNKDEKSWAKRLVQEVQKRECLYDSSHPDYKDRQKIEREWEQIGEIMESSADIVRKRWQNLRGSFSKAINAKSRGGSFDAKPHKFYLMEQMSFLKDYMNPSVPINLWKTGMEIGPDYEEKQEPPSPPASTSELNTSVEDTYLPASPISSSMGRDILRLKRKHPFPVEDAMVTFLRHQEKLDEDLCFFKGLLPHVRELNKKRKRAFFQLITCELFKSLSEQENDLMPSLVLDVSSVS